MSIPGGFDWNQPETGFTYRSDSFTTTRDAIIADRRANPRHKLRTDNEHVEWEMEVRYEAKLRAMPGGDQWLVPGPTASSPPVFLNPRSRAVPAAGIDLGKTKASLSLLLDFLGPTLKPVKPELAEHRASICVTCPENKKVGGVEHIIGEGLKMLMEFRSSTNLKTSHEENLHECAVCSCNLKLKTHVALDFIMKHTKPEMFSRLPEFCWIRKESQATKP